MYTNSDCTVYSKTENGYKAIYISGCYFQEVKATEIKKYGAELADSIKVIIPSEFLSGYKSEWDIPEGSYIGRGCPGFDFSETIEPLLNSVFAVNSVTDHLSGSDDVRHITVGAG